MGRCDVEGKRKLKKQFFNRILPLINALKILLVLYILLLLFRYLPKHTKQLGVLTHITLLYLPLPTYLQFNLSIVCSFYVYI